MTSKQPVIGTLVLLVTLAAGCGGGDDDGDAAASPDTTTATETTTVPASEEPIGVVALGHSGITGQHSVAVESGDAEQSERSWATGTAPEVNSVATRLEAVHPGTLENTINEGGPSAPASALASQANAALARVPTPELVLIQTMDDEVDCEGDLDATVTSFGTNVAAALDVISTKSPESNILIVSQPGRPANELPTWPQEDRAALSGTGPCDFFDSEGNVRQVAADRLTGVIEALEAEQARVCAEVPNCATDDGVFAAFVRDAQETTEEETLAEMIWPTVERILGL